MSAIITEKIRKEFGTLIAVNDVDLDIQPGQVLGLVGPNGAGKTTLLRMLATLLEPTDGNASVLGFDLRKKYLKIRRHIGFMPDFFNLYNDLTLQECLRFFAKAYKVKSRLISERVDTALKHVDLEDKRTDFIRNLSRGMVQRMGVAALLVHDPDILLLDEPASGLDPAARIKLRSILKDLSGQGRTIIISSHILTELSGLCSHIAIMNQGSIIAAGTVDEIHRQLAPKRTFTIELIDNAETAVGVIAEITYAETVSHENNTLTVHIDGGPEQFAMLNQTLVENRIQVVEFYENKADLEDIFMQISSA